MAGPRGKGVPGTWPQLLPHAGSVALVRPHARRDPHLWEPGGTPPPMGARRDPGLWEPGARGSCLSSSSSSGLVQEPPGQMATPEAGVCGCEAPARSQEAPQGQMLIPASCSSAWPPRTGSERRCPALLCSGVRIL